MALSGNARSVVRCPLIGGARHEQPAVAPASRVMTFRCLMVFARGGDSCDLEAITFEGGKDFPVLRVLAGAVSLPAGSIVLN
jgi:hypothetical protein